MGQDATGLALASSRVLSMRATMIRSTCPHCKSTLPLANPGSMIVCPGCGQTVRAEVLATSVAAGPPPTTSLPPAAVPVMMTGEEGAILRWLRWVGPLAPLRLTVWVVCLVYASAVFYAYRRDVERADTPDQRLSVEIGAL